MAVEDSEQPDGRDEVAPTSARWAPRPAHDWRRRLTDLERADEPSTEPAAAPGPGSTASAPRQEEWSALDHPDPSDEEWAAGEQDALDTDTDTDTDTVPVGEEDAPDTEAAANRDAGRAPPVPPPPPPPPPPPGGRPETPATGAPPPRPATSTAGPAPSTPPSGAGLLPSLAQQLDALASDLERATSAIGERLDALPDRLGGTSTSLVPAGSADEQLTSLLDRVGHIESAVGQLAGTVQDVPLSRTEVASSLDTLGTNLRRGLDRFVSQVIDQVASLQHGTNRELRDLRDQTDRLGRALASIGPDIFDSRALTPAGPQTELLERLSAQLEASSWVLGEAAASGDTPAATLESVAGRLDEVAETVASALGEQHDALEGHATQLRKLQATSGLLARGTTPGARQLHEQVEALTERVDALDATLAERLDGIDATIADRLEHLEDTVTSTLTERFDQLDGTVASTLTETLGERMQRLEESMAATVSSVEQRVDELAEAASSREDAAAAADAASAAAQRTEAALTEVTDELRNLRRRIRLRFEGESK